MRSVLFNFLEQQLIVGQLFEFLVRMIRSRCPLRRMFEKRETFQFVTDFLCLLQLFRISFVGFGNCRSSTINIQKVIEIRNNSVIYAAPWFCSLNKAATPLNAATALFHKQNIVGRTVQGDTGKSQKRTKPSEKFESYVCPLTN